MNISSVNEIMGNVSDKLALLNLGEPTQSKSALIASAVIGLIICFFGLKLIKVLAAITGMVAGACIGAAVGAGFGLTGLTLVIAVIAGAAITGAISFFLYQFGIFLVALIYCFGIGLTFVHSESVIVLIICFVVSVIVAVLAVINMEPIVIIITSLSGGITAGIAAASLVGLTSSVWIGYGAGAVLAVVGIVVQFMVHSSKIGKKEKIYSKRVKKEVSMESEVEKARQMLDDESEDDKD